MTELYARLWAHKEPGPRWKVGEATDVLMEPSLTDTAVAKHLRMCASRNMIHARETRGSGPNAHNLFAASDLATAKVLHHLITEWGVADVPMLQAIAVGFYAAPAAEAQGRFFHPITAAIAGTHDGTPYVCRIDTERAANGQRNFATRIFPEGSPPPVKPGVRSSMLIPLGPLLAPIIAAAEAKG